MDAGHPLVKEPNIHTDSLERYSRLFPDEPGSRKVEATTHYLFQETARKHLARMESEPLIVAILRAPAERVWSSFQYTQNNRARIDPSLRFHQYVDWGLEESYDSIQDHISHSGSAYVLSRDIKYGQYIEYLLPWRETVGKERLVIVSFEEMITDPEATCRRLATRLDVDPKFYDDFEFKARNTSYVTSSRLLHSLARSIGKQVPESRMKRLSKQIYMAVATSEHSTRPKEAEQAMQRLKKHYTPYSERLAEEFDIDVSPWT